ncbi:hypothetical protein [Thiocapsa roseopersicina]|uniref:Uncharacterized protein n=1 Tax=Thiocapsa roseopersicina TaxID=1058 RepID=A0A1H3DCV3_THIRO|nr:hypothetical protein [Thiocapsa roseopersicina]SDX63978.1 hypothetical protein SAMN05421783_14610 [Thiocapsa roseopersicina]
MAEPTCDGCLYWIEGRCSDGGRWFDFSKRRHAGKLRLPESPACAHYQARRLPPFFFDGGIDPEDKPDVERATADSMPFLPSQAEAIQALLAKAGTRTAASEAALHRAWRVIRDAACLTQFRLRSEYSNSPPKPYQLMTELARTTKRGVLSGDPNPILLSALAYGALRIGLTDAAPTDHAFLRSLSADDLRRVVEAARSDDATNILRMSESSLTDARMYLLRIVVKQFNALSGRRGTPFARDAFGRVHGDLIDLCLVALAPIEPGFNRESLARDLKAIRREPKGR